MSLILVQPGFEPAGQFDLMALTVISGGEVGVLDTIDLLNGYQVIKARKATTGDAGPFFLLDDGTTGYGISFGSTVVKTSTGFVSGMNDYIRIGPPSYSASDKVTLWNKPGLYAITLDSLADTEVSLKAAAPGTGMTFDIDGKLLLGNISTTPIAYVIQFKIDETLVTTGGNILQQKKLIIIFNPFGQA